MNQTNVLVTNTFGRHAAATLRNNARLFFISALLAVTSISTSFAHTVQIKACYNGGGSYTFYALSYHSTGSPIGGIIVNGNTYNFTSVIPAGSIPACATLGQASPCSGTPSGVNWQVVTVNNLIDCNLSVTTTCTSVVECPWPNCFPISINADGTAPKLHAPYTAPSSPVTLSGLERNSTYSNVSINGNGMNSIVVDPGSPVTMTYSRSTVSVATYCPNCITQHYIGLQGVFAYCQFSVTGNSSANHSVSFTAPTTPGVYYITQSATWWYHCGQFGVPGFSNDLGDAMAVVVVAGCPSDITASNDQGLCGATVNYVTPLAWDKCSGATVSCSPASGSFFNTGATTVTCTATDESNNTSTCSFTVTVNDTEVPTITAPADVTAYTDPGVCTTNAAGVALGVPTVWDNCPGVTYGNDAPGSYPKGNTTVTWTATDGSGNTATATQIVTIIDNEAPVITPNASATMWPPNHKYQSFSLTDMVASVSDNCPGVSIADINIRRVWSDEPEDVGGGGDGNTIDDIVIAGDCKSVQLRKERQGGGNGRVYTVELSLTDVSGNTTIATFQASVPHNQNGTAFDDGAAAGYTVNSGCYMPKLSGRDARGNATTPFDYQLGQNFPNPFNPTTNIRYSIPENGLVSLNVYDMQSNIVARLVNQEVSAGSYTVSFDASALPSGTYLYKLECNGRTLTRTMSLVK